MMRGVAWVVMLGFALCAWMGVIFVVRLSTGVLRVIDGSTLIQSDNQGGLP